MRRGGIAAFLLCSLALAAPTRAAAPAASFDYLYIEASSGSSAGGHAAVRFGDEVFHFQHHDPGVISAAVQPWSSFDLEYRGISNRPIHVLRVAVAENARDRLRDTFHRRHVVQTTQLAVLDSARRDAELLHCLARGERDGQCGLSLEGAGYFSAADSGDERRFGVTAIDELRTAIRERYGLELIERRRRELRSEIEGLRPRRLAVPVFEDGRVAIAAPGFADAYTNLLLEWLAFEVIAGEQRANPAAFRKCPGGLTDRERASLAGREAAQRAAALHLLSSGREDRGYALLIALARLAALRASRESGELYVLDTYASDAREVSLATIAGGDILRRALRERRAEARAARSVALSGAPVDELDWSRLEIAANVALELEQALAGKPLRVASKSLSPSRGARLSAAWPAPQVDRRSAATAAVPPTRNRKPDPGSRIWLARANARRDEITRRLRDLYRYDLIRRNCVTEIFRTMEEGDLSSEIGGRVEVAATASFIPFVSAAAVKSSYPVTEARTLPSYRQMVLGRMEEASRASWAARLREQVSLTSTVTPLDADEEVFLFFSSDSVAMRPLAGAANLIFGMGGVVGGLIAAPFDGALLLRASARGVFYSVPELAFINLRKGTTPVLGSRWEEDPTPLTPLPAAGRGEL